jgi:hypothetical protein
VESRFAGGNIFTTETVVLHLVRRTRRPYKGQERILPPFQGLKGVWGAGFRGLPPPAKHCRPFGPDRKSKNVESGFRRNDNRARGTQSSIHLPLVGGRHPAELDFKQNGIEHGHKPCALPQADAIVPDMVLQEKWRKTNIFLLWSAELPI